MEYFPPNSLLQNEEKREKSPEIGIQLPTRLISPNLRSQMEYSPPNSLLQNEEKRDKFFRNRHPAAHEANLALQSKTTEEVGKEWENFPFITYLSCNTIISDGNDVLSGGHAQIATLEACINFHKRPRRSPWPPKIISKLICSSTSPSRISRRVIKAKQSLGKLLDFYRQDHSDIRQFSTSASTKRATKSLLFESRFAKFAGFW
ncbi:hypothetical protein DFH27DRAFT_191467 [Peziza echinospora]|nr:hypothetical protein DFH27DRAFT_191467 [Peziza echinospora]